MKPTVKLDINQWSYQEFNRFMASAAGEDDPNEQFDLADQIIVSWSYETPVADGIGGLPSLNESLAVIRAIYNTIKDFMETVETEGVDLDLSQWNLSRYQEFNTVRMGKNILKAEKMLHEVAKLQGTSPDDPLTAVQGARMMKAVSDAITKALQGKN